LQALPVPAVAAPFHDQQAFVMTSPSSTLPAVLERIFKLIGRDLHAEIPMVRLDPQYRLKFGSGGELDF